MMGLKCSTSCSPGSSTHTGCVLELVHSASLPMRGTHQYHLLLPSLEQLLQSLCCETLRVAGLPGHAIRHFKPCLLVAKALSDVPSWAGDKGDSYLAFARDFEDIGAVGVYTPLQAENKLSNTYFLTFFSCNVPYRQPLLWKEFHLVEKKSLKKKRGNWDV